MRRKIEKLTEARDLHKGVFSFLTSLAIVLFIMFVIIGGLAYFTDIFDGISGTGMGGGAIDGGDGDSNGDRYVNGTDRRMFIRAYGRTSSEAGYVPYFDYDSDGDVDRSDYAEFLKRLRQGYLGP